MTVKVKICGITTEEALRTAVEAGADALGFVFKAPSSPRNLPLDKAKKLISKVPPYVYAVAVTALPSIGEIAAAAKTLCPHAVQLHGIPTAEGYIALRKLLPPGIRIIGALSLAADARHPRRPQRENLKLASRLKRVCDAVIVDSAPIGSPGGTGQRSDWVAAAKAQQLLGSTPMILAGGLGPSNVGEAVRVVKPYAVDASTGVESAPGVKDPEKIRLFVRNAKGEA